jgi:hypothetical protein
MVAANGILHVHSRREAELEKTRRIVSTCGLYLSRALTFVNGRARRVLILGNVIFYGFVKRGSI